MPLRKKTTSLNQSVTFVSAHKRYPVRGLLAPLAQRVTYSMSQLISDEYRKLNAQLHQNPQFGKGGDSLSDVSVDFIKKHSWMTVLDYGAGKQGLTFALRERLPGVRVDAYDPAFPEISDIELDKYDYLICKDVIEHIEPEFLDAVLEDIASHTGQLAFLLISTRPAHKVLPDGRNAHLIVENADWWTEKLQGLFKIVNSQTYPEHAQFLVKPL